MHPFLPEYAAARQDELLAAGVRSTPIRREPARQRLGWWLMELGLRLATPKRREGLLEGI
ncbi:MULTISPECIES: hypothetical protein [Actinomycetes]|uniref:hypothetical protein n=1 Tax=Actinomycetes TaxID=1760 RepID=UPI00131A3ABC|nr:MULTISPECIES: hypothetical protein [Actinomycetes]